MDKINIHFAGYQGKFSVHSKAITMFKENLRSILGDKLNFSQTDSIIDLGRSATDLIEMVSSGEITFCYIASSYLADRVPEFELLDLPFTINNREQAYALMDGPLGKFLSDKTADTSNFRILSWWDNGFRHFSNNIRPIKKPEDCLGLKIRTLRSNIYTETLSVLGFDPIYSDVSQIKSLVSSGAIDAQENALSNILNFGFHEHHRWITLSNHFFGPAVILCHKNTYDGWSSELKEIITSELAKTTDYQRTLAALEESEVIENFDLSKNTIYTLDENEVEVFSSKVQPIIEKTVHRFRNELFEFLIH
jgi:C4-dicarboxylate-binding protein DctP